MLSPLRNRFGIPGVISVIALVFAMLGGAYAANNSNGGNATASAKAKKGPRGPKGPKGDTGATGSTGAPGKDGTNGTNGTNGKDGAPGAPGKDGTSVTNTPIAPGPSDTKCNHQGGAEFKVGSGTATTACNGQTGFTDFLPSGKTETGMWGASLRQVGGSTTSEVHLPISFSIPLAATSEDAFYFDAEETANEEFGTTGCTGSAINPTAPAGTLCIYTAEENDTNFLKAAFPVYGGEFGYSKPGTILRFSVNDTAANAFFQRNGTWAVTAP